MKQGPGRDGVRGGTPSAGGMSGGARRGTGNSYRPYGAAAREYQNRVSIAVKKARKAASKAESDRMARLYGTPPKPPAKKNTISTNTEMNRMTEQSLKRRIANERMSKAKRTGTKAGVSAAGAGAVAAALPKKKTSGAEGPKKSMPVRKAARKKA